MERRPILCLVTDRRASRLPLAEAVAAAARAGLDWLQVRERDLDGGALLDLAESLRDAARAGAGDREVKILVNRRVDVALALGAGGVHLGFDAMPARTARELLGSDATLGMATHDAAEAQSAAGQGLDYVLLAPVFKPISKAATRRPLGLHALREATSGPIPVLAQGGIRPANAGAAVASGAAGVAVTGAILQADDPGQATAALRAALDAGGSRA